MWEFLQEYGYWIVLAGFFLLMLRMHGSGGCGMGHGSHAGHGDRREPTDARRRTGAGATAADEPDDTSARPPATTGSGRCH